MSDIRPLFPLTGQRASPPLPFSGIRPTNGIDYYRGVDSYEALRTNFRSLLAAAKKDSRVGPNGVLALEAETGISKTTLYEVRSSAVTRNLSLEFIIRIAKAYGLEAWELLTPPDVRRRITHRDLVFKLISNEAIPDDGTASMGNSDPPDGQDSDRHPLRPVDSGKPAAPRRKGARKPRA